MALDRAHVPEKRMLSLCLSAASLSAIALFVLCPIAVSSGGPEGAVAVEFYASLSHVCHQLPERSFAIRSVPMPVCVRCTGVAVGVALGLLTMTALGVPAPRLRYVVVAAGAVAFDVAAETVGVHGDVPILRLSTGVALGCAVSPLLPIAFAGVVARLRGL